MADDEQGTDGISVNDLWAAEAKEFFEAHPPTEMTEDELATVDLRNRDTFPLTMTGYKAWKVAAGHYALENPVIQDEDGGPVRSGTPDAGAQAVKQATKKVKSGPRTPEAKAAFIRAVRANTSPGVLDR